MAPIVNKELVTCQRCKSDSGRHEKDFASNQDSKFRPASSKSPRSAYMFRVGILVALFVAVLVLSSVETAEGRRIKNRNKPGETPPGSPTEKKTRRKEGKILKTSEKARIITQRKYLVRDWCKSKPLKQLVRTSNGCKGVFINHFCYGQCNSFYIPRDLTPEMTEPAYFKSCAFCKPHREEKISVTLTCSRSRGRRNRYIKRIVNKIKDCRCIAVPDFESQSTPASSQAAIPAASSSASTDVSSMAGKGSETAR